MSATTRDGRNGSKQSIGFGNSGQSAHSGDSMPGRGGLDIPSSNAPMTSVLNHDTADFGAAACQSFDSSLANAIRMIRRSAQGLTPRESQLLSDVARGRGRAFRLVAEVADIARYRCFDPADATALAECIRGYVLRGHPGLVLPWLDTLRYEGSTNAAADEALIEHVLSPSKATGERMVETHVAQSIASRAVADLIYTHRGR